MRRVRMTTAAWAACVAAALALNAAWTGGAQAEGAESPEAVFQGMKTAVETEAYGDAAGLIAPSDRKLMAASVAMMVSMSGAMPIEMLPPDKQDGFRQMQGLKTQYNLPDINPMSDMGPDGPAPETKQAVMDAVGDGVAFLGDAMPLIAVISDEGIPTPVRQEGLAVDGDTATAEVTSQMTDGQEKTETEHYVKVDGAWYMALPPEGKAEMEKMFGAVEEG